MRYRKLGNSDLNISVIGLGSWITGRTGWHDVKDSESEAVIKTALENGINFIDTAPIYGNGHAESVVGKTIKPFRDKVILATKCGLKEGFIHDLSKKQIFKEIEDSLRRLQTEYIDLYQPHWPDPRVDIQETMEALLILQDKGLIRHIGFCNHQVSLLEKALTLGELVSVQHQYSLLDRTIENEIVQFALKNKIGVLAYGPLHGGLLTGKYKTKPDVSRKEAKVFFYQFMNDQIWNKSVELVADLKSRAEMSKRSIASEVLCWTIQQPGITCALTGMRNLKQLADNLKGLF
ncbi:MAG: aldo/keto reductase [Candidatus Margulisbacteria bacterium]|nr:aldo/keto reductase [Candidatus Margulisiibacteriota bacterium]